MPLSPLTPRVLMRNTAPNIIGYSEGCTDVREMGQSVDWQAPTKFRRLSSLGSVYRQMFRVQCTVQYPGRRELRGKPKKVILGWAGTQAPGLRSEELLPGRPSLNTPVWVSCSCNYFRFVCEWALSRYGSSDIIYSNGRPALITNPRGVGTLCKHVYAAIPYAISAWDGEMAEDVVVEEPVDEVPDIPTFSPANEPPPNVDLAPVSNVRESSALALSGYFDLSRRLRSLAFPFDSSCC